ncbi:MAG: pyrroline-5-carboxylate reductase [Aquabacterium sp.]
MTPDTSTVAFIGGGNMASALIGGLVGSGADPSCIQVVEPHAPQRALLAQRFAGVQIWPAAQPALAGAALVVWAVKPQSFAEAAAACGDWTAHALHLSVMAGVRCGAIARASGATRVVRSMPNTPALIGRGIAGLFAMPQVSDADRARVVRLLAPTGQLMWLPREDDLDAVTALSGSGPAYVFYFVEAMMQAAQDMGLSAEQGRTLALATFDGAAALAAQSSEPPSVLRERVTSKGGTTHAALESLRADAVAEAFVRALQAARRRAAELGDAFG